MVDVRPFRGLRFNPSRVGDLGRALSPPYDVISADEQRELLAANAWNIVRIELPTDDSGDRYASAAQTLDQWRAEGVLARDERPSLYLYEVRFRLGDEERVRRSIMVALRLEPWESGHVLPHERTLSEPKEDRLRLLRATRANISPVWALHRDASGALARAWAWADGQPADSSCQLDEGTEHRLWKVDDDELVE